MKNENVHDLKNRGLGINYRFCLMSVFIFIVTFILSYKQSTMASDLEQHIGFAKWNNIKSGELVHFGWHAIYMLVSNFCSVEFSAAFSNALFNMAAVICCYIVVKCYLYKVPPLLIYFISVLLMFVNPIYMVLSDVRFYEGQILANPWHNPTYFAIKGIGILIIFLATFIIEKVMLNVELYFFMFILSTISIILKPSFLQVFLPAIFLYCILSAIISKNKDKIKTYMLLLISLLPSLIGICLQYLTLFGTNKDNSDGGIAFGMFVVWRNASQNIFLSTILSFLFPILIMIFSGKKYYMKERNIIVLTFFLVAFMEFSFVYENNERIYHGNFAWGFMFASLILFINSIVEFLCIKRDGLYSKIQMLILNASLALHTVSGVIYYIYLLLFSTYQQ